MRLEFWLAAMVAWGSPVRTGVYAVVPCDEAGASEPLPVRGTGLAYCVAAAPLVERSDVVGAELVGGDVKLRVLQGAVGRVPRSAFAAGNWEGVVGEGRLLAVGNIFEEGAGLSLAVGPVSATGDVLAAFGAARVEVPEPPAATDSFRIGSGAQGQSMPLMVRLREHQYTEGARARRIQGSVSLQVVVGPLGVPTEVRVLRALDPELDAEAVACARYGRYAVRWRDGGAVAQTVTWEMNFRLLD